MTSSRSGLRPPKRTRFSTSCVENRFSPVESGGVVDRRRSQQAARSRADRTAPRTSAGRTARARAHRRAPRRGRISSWHRRQACAPGGRIDFTASTRREIVGERHAADFHLHHRVAGIEMAAHLVLQVRDGFAGRIPAAADVAEHFVDRPAAVVALGEQPMQRLSGDLGDRVPDRDLDGADADRALAVAAGFFVLHHDGEDFFRREIVARVVEQRFRIGASGCAE